MKKKEALSYIRKYKGYVPYIQLFEMFDDDDIPQMSIDLECEEDKPRCNHLILNKEVAKIIENFI
jgi:hypothetical protein